jgi:hypothetical protein
LKEWKLLQYGTGLAAGYGTGFAAGSGTGFAAGYGTGYGTGFAAGYGMGFAAGYGTGFAAGYGTGFAAGYGESFHVYLPFSFISTLVTAVLTYHLAWIPTVTPAGAIPSRTYLDKHSAKWVRTLNLIPQVNFRECHWPILTSRQSGTYLDMSPGRKGNGRYKTIGKINGSLP